MDAELGKASDRIAALRIGVSVPAAKSRRERLGISLPDHYKNNWPVGADRHRWTKEEIALLGTMPDAELAKKLNISRNKVAARRISQGIAATNNTPRNLRGHKEVSSHIFSFKSYLGESKSLSMVLRDDQWGKIKKLLPGGAMGFSQTEARKRLFVEAVLWMLRTENPWRDLPTEFGNWPSVRMRFERWSDQGVWKKVFAVLVEDAKLAGSILDDRAFFDRRCEQATS